jgi:hypothetical protein
MGQPYSSPWGAVQTCEELVNGVFQVTTAGHGGIMVRQNSADFLSPEARKCGFREDGFLCYEEDCNAQIVIRELLDKKLWEPQLLCADKKQYEIGINESLQMWHPEYWATRSDREQPPAPEKSKQQSLSDRLKDGAEKAAAHNKENSSGKRVVGLREAG